jgi:hypothetical protein
MSPEQERTFSLMAWFAILGFFAFLLYKFFIF